MTTLGIQIEELIDLLSIGHEAVFILNGKEYIIQPEASDNSYDLVMYQSEPNISYLCRIPIPKEHCKTNSEGFKKTVEQLLSTKCIDGKSFMDLLKQIHVEEIF